MIDLNIAKNGLEGHSICLCKGGERIVRDERGISPMMNLIASGAELAGYSVADVVVGKAAALLFVKCKIKSVFAKVLSSGAKRILELYGVAYECETLTERIINRAGTDTCPMEKAVADTDDPEEAYVLLKNQLIVLRKH